VKKEQKPAVIIARKPCALMVYREALRKGVSITVYTIDQDKCIKCGTCVNLFACPAIYVKDNKYAINPVLCTGCGVCAQICAANAIVPRGE